MQKYLEKMKSSIIYKVLNEVAEVKYFGSTDSIFRLNFHKNGYGKLDLKNTGGEILYSVVKDVSRLELYFIEYHLIHKYNPIENDTKGNLDDFEFTQERKDELIKIAENLEYNIFN